MKNKYLDYLLLALISLGFISYIYRVKDSPAALLVSTLVFSGGYLLWGVFHESRRANLHPKVMLEYLLVALLGVAIVSTLLL